MKLYKPAEVIEAFNSYMAANDDFEAVDADAIDAMTPAELDAYRQAGLEHAADLRARALGHLRFRFAISHDEAEKILKAGLPPPPAEPSGKKKRKMTFSMVEGSSETGSIVRESLEDIYYRQLELAAGMIHCGEINIVIEGRQMLRKAAGILAKAENNRLGARVNNTEVAKRPRLKTRSTMKARIMEAMAKSHRDGRQFKDFMAAWRKDPIDGLRLDYLRDSDKYRVTDEHGGDGHAEYTFGTLEKNWSKSKA